MNGGNLRVRVNVLGRQRQRGVALVVGLLLLLVLTLLALSSMTSATLELLLSGNVQYQERAFQAAEAGIEQALAAGGFEGGADIGSYDDLAAADPLPIRGTGAAIAGCEEEPDAGATRQCEYFLRYDAATGATPVPPSWDGTLDESGTGLAAYHFVIDSYGVSNRGAVAELTQGFYVIGLDTGGATLPAATSGPQRTYWRQRGAD
jgi:type IV pilus assembly protein PilX